MIIGGPTVTNPATPAANIIGMNARAAVGTKLPDEEYRKETNLLIIESLYFFGFIREATSIQFFPTTKVYIIHMYF